MIYLTDNNVGRLSAELGDDALEAGILADLGGTVHILHREDGAEAEQEDLGQRCNQLK